MKTSRKVKRQRRKGIVSVHISQRERTAKAKRHKERAILTSSETIKRIGRLTKQSVDRAHKRGDQQQQQHNQKMLEKIEENILHR